jgi:PAS domain S-box-containing protein
MSEESPVPEAVLKHVNALRRSEERYRALVEAVSQTVWSWDAVNATGDFEKSREWWEELTGQPIDEQKASGDAWLAMVHPDDRDLAAETWNSATIAGVTYESVYRVRGRLGGWRHVCARGVPIRDSSGQVREWIGTLDDVTVQRDAVAEREGLLASAEAERRQLAEVFSHAPSFIAVLRGPQHIFERVNDRYVELIGGRNVIGLSVRQALPELEGYFELLDEVYRTGKPHVTVDAQVTLQNPAAPTERLLHFVYQPMLDARGAVSGVIVQGIDMTGQRRAEAGLARIMAESGRQQRMYETALSNTADFIYLFDTAGRFTYVNKALLDLWSKDLSQAVGRNFFELDYPPELADRLERQIQQVIVTARPLRDETPYTSALGTRAYEYIFVPVLAADGSVEAVAPRTADGYVRHCLSHERRLGRDATARRS